MKKRNLVVSVCTAAIALAGVFGLAGCGDKTTDYTPTKFTVTNSETLATSPYFYPEQITVDYDKEYESNSGFLNVYDFYLKGKEEKFYLISDIPNVHFISDTFRDLYFYNVSEYAYEKKDTAAESLPNIITEFKFTVFNELLGSSQPSSVDFDAPSGMESMGAVFLDFIFAPIIKDTHEPCIEITFGEYGQDNSRYVNLSYGNQHMGTCFIDGSDEVTESWVKNFISAFLVDVDNLVVYV